MQGGYLNPSGVVRIGNTIVRSQDHLWPAAVSEALLVIQQRGFTACPREVTRLSPHSVVMTYLPGSSLRCPIPRWATSIPTLVRVTRLVGAFSLAGTNIRSKLAYSDWLLPSASSGDVFVHGDPHPTNIVFNRRRHPTALIDFELATLGTHNWNLVSLLYAWVPLEPIASSCWSAFPTLSLGPRLDVVLRSWPMQTSRDVLISAATEFLHWRKGVINLLAEHGNPGAVRFVADPAEFERRYTYSLTLLSTLLGRL